jgi:membrane-associated phospholipid phosphatase
VWKKVFVTTARTENDRTASPDGTRRPADRRVVTFVVLSVLYAIYTVATVHHTWIPELDQRIYDLHIKRKLVPRHLFWPVYDYVTLGQRGPATLVFLPYFIWTAHRMRSARPLVMLVVSLLLLNVSVGAVKLLTGRIGPHESANVHNVFNGGNIYPSGHVSNAVVLYGLVAWISLRHRKLFVAAAVWIAVSVGAGTIAINTHWFSDVVGGWFAGGLVLLALPWFLPPAERLVDANYARLKGWYQRRRGHRPSTDAVGEPDEVEPTPDVPVPLPDRDRSAKSLSPAEGRRRITTAPRPRARHARPTSDDAGRLDNATP